MPTRRPFTLSPIADSYSGTGTSAEVVSLGSTLAIDRNRIAASRTVRAIGPSLVERGGKGDDPPADEQRAVGSA